jgi:glycosyltransferase involved in cell wall biosynthesis
MKLDVCICTHNPRPEVFQVVLSSLANQTLSKDAYQVWVIDNASVPAIALADLAPLTDAGVTYHLCTEPRLGVMYARKLASQVAQGETIVFVDDDNELLPNYLEIALEVANNHPEIGCCGGKLLSGIDIDYPRWMEPLLPYVGIKDLGDEIIAKHLDEDYYWGEWEPPAAGSVVRKVVLKRYFDKLENFPPEIVFGRQGKQGLLSSEDSFIAGCAYELGLQCAYYPKLQLIHRIDPNRLQFKYFVKLLYSYGCSEAILKQALGQPIKYNPIASVAKKIKWWLGRGVSLRHLICILAWDVGHIRQLTINN